MWDKKHNYSFYFWSTTWTTYKRHLRVLLEQLISSWKWLWKWVHPRTLKMEAMCSPKMYVHFYQTTWCHKWEDSILQTAAAFRTWKTTLISNVKFILEQGGVEVYLYSFLNLGARWRWVGASTPYLLTPWRRVLLEKLTGLQLVKKFPIFYGTQRFMTTLHSIAGRYSSST
jgi:hypothetical protein